MSMDAAQLQRFQWAQLFTPFWERLAAEHCTRARIGTPFEDMRCNTDLVLCAQADMRFALRSRKFGPQRNGADMTIRYRLASGADTEWHRFVRGWEEPAPRFYLYGWQSKPGSRVCDPWHIVDFTLLTEHIRSGGRHEPIPNGDGSWLTAIRFDDLPLGAVYAGTGQQDLFAELFGDWETPR